MEFTALDDLNQEFKRIVAQMLRAPNLTQEQVLALSDLYTVLSAIVDYNLAIVDKAFTLGEDNI
jgi:hypothetical protein